MKIFKVDSKSNILKMKKGGNEISVVQLTYIAEIKTVMDWHKINEIFFDE